jgi:hypothetical protein
MDVGLLDDLHGVPPALGVHCLDVCIRDRAAWGADGIGGIAHWLRQFGDIDRMDRSRVLGRWAEDWRPATVRGLGY